MSMRLFFGNSAKGPTPELLFSTLACRLGERRLDEAPDEFYPEAA
jgi:hypothetical protein